MEKRDFYRASLKRDYSAQFQLGGQTYAEVQISNIGARGCCVRLPAASAQHLEGKPVLDNLLLFRPGAQPYALKGRIAWHDDLRSAKGDWITAGVEFMESPAACIREIRESVAEELSMWDISR